MAQTAGTQLGVFSGATFAEAWDNPSNQDVFQVVNEGGEVVWNCDHAGTCNATPAAPTQQALFRMFGSSVENAFVNEAHLDIVQIYGPGQSLVYYIDYTGTSHT